MFKKTITQLFILTIVLSCIFIANGLILAWTPPGDSPPDPNVDAPINVGSTSQYKEGALGIEGIFRGYSNAIFDGNVGIGTATLSSGLKLDVEGKVGATEYCNENGENCVEISEIGGLSGYEIKTASKRSAYHFTVDIYCSPGKKILGGGCNQEAGGNRAIVDNNPIGTTGWHCRGRDINTAQTVTMTAYAICAILD